MGAGVFHVRVRDGIGCIIPAMTTGSPGQILLGYPECCVFKRACWRGLVLRAVRPFGRATVVMDMSSIGRLGPLGCVGCPTSTCGLSTCWSSTTLEGNSVSRWVSRLDAFSGYPVRT